MGQGEIAGDSRLVPRRHRLHGRDVQKRRQADICQGSCVAGPCRSVQLQPRRECQARHRYPRRRKGRCGGLEGSHPRCRDAQSHSQEQAQATTNIPTPLTSSEQVPDFANYAKFRMEHRAPLAYLPEARFRRVYSRSQFSGVGRCRGQELPHTPNGQHSQHHQVWKQ